MIKSIKALLKGICIKFYFIFIKFSWMLINPRKPKEELYSIGITTFLLRYENLFKPMLKQIVSLYPESEILVAINGHYKENEQKEYLLKINSFLKQYSNVKLISYLSPQPLSKMWNQIILKSENQNVLLLNDDLILSPSFRKKVDSNYSYQFTLINRTFSHFLITKETIKKVGFFDERFLEIGGEDDDYLIRLEILGLKPHVIWTKTVMSERPKPIVNSYGKKTEQQQQGYSNINSDFLLRKWSVSNIAKEGYIFSRNRYWKLKEGMDTPGFY